MDGIQPLSALLRMLMKPIIRPLARLLVGLLAIPMFRLFVRRVARVQELDEELEKDLEQWFRGALVLLVATKNMESNLFDWYLGAEPAGMDPILFALRLSLAIAVIEFMPDQELFAIIHANPPHLDFKKNGYWVELRAKWWPFLRGTLAQQVNRYAPVLAIISVAFSGVVGWIGYFSAITLYLFIGLVTSRDKALDVLSEFDRQVAMRRRDIIEELHLEEHPPDFDPQPVASVPRSEEATAESSPADVRGDPVNGTVEAGPPDFEPVPAAGHAPSEGRGEPE
jgi:hypothetical protein